MATSVLPAPRLTRSGLPPARTWSITWVIAPVFGILVGGDDDGVFRTLGVHALDQSAHFRRRDLAAIHPDVAIGADSDDDVAVVSRCSAVIASGLVTFTPACFTNEVMMMKENKAGSGRSPAWGARSMPWPPSFQSVDEARIGLFLRRARRDRDVVNAAQAHLVHDLDHDASRGLGVGDDDDRTFRLLGMEALDIGTHRSGIKSPGGRSRSGRCRALATNSVPLSSSCFCSWLLGAGRDSVSPTSLTKTAVMMKKMKQVQDENPASARRSMPVSLSSSSSSLWRRRRMARACLRNGIRRPSDSVCRRMRDAK